MWFWPKHPFILMCLTNQVLGLCFFLSYLLFCKVGTVSYILWKIHESSRRYRILHMFTHSLFSVIMWRNIWKQSQKWLIDHYAINLKWLNCATLKCHQQLFLLNFMWCKVNHVFLRILKVQLAFILFVILLKPYFNYSILFIL